MFIPQGLRLVHSGSVTQANIKLATVNAGAMIDIGIDWSAYAGNDAGSTPYMLILYDSAGKRMQGFIGASGGGEAYGAELITNGNMETGDPPSSWAPGPSLTWERDINPHAGTYCGKLSAMAASNKFVDQDRTLIAGALYKLFGWGKVTVGDGIALQVTGSPLSKSVWIAATSWILFANQFFTADQITIKIRLYNASNGDICWADDITLKQITDISTNGVHLHSTRGGTDRNVASIDSAFDLNNSYTFKIYACP